MLKTDTDSFLDWMTACEELPDVMTEYGITEEDIGRMEEDPEKYLPFAVYLLSLERKEEPANEDALPEDELMERLNDFVRRHTELA